MTRHKGTDFRTPPLVLTLIHSSQMSAVGHVSLVTLSERHLGLVPSIQNINSSGHVHIVQMKSSWGIIIQEGVGFDPR